MKSLYRCFRRWLLELRFKIAAALLFGRVVPPEYVFALTTWVRDFDPKKAREEILAFINGPEFAKRKGAR